MANSRLQQSPDGLLALYRLQTLGRSPEAFGDTVVGTVDTRDFYAMSLLIGGFNENAPAAFPISYANTDTRGPNLYRSLSGSITMGAAGGTYLSWALGFQLPGHNFTYLHTGFIPSAVAGAVYFVGGTMEAIVLPPGARKILAVFSDAAGADHVVSIRDLHAGLSNT